MSGIAQDIIQDCLKGNRRAQSQLYNQYCDAMFNVCLRMLKNRTDSEDVLQIAFVDVFRKLDQYRYEASIGAWIKRIVINQCLSFLRSKKPIEEWDDQLKHIPEEVPDESDMTYHVEKIKRGMEQLSDGYRVILNLYLFEGLDHIEIGEFLGISSSTSKSQYHRGKKQLMAILKSI